MKIHDLERPSHQNIKTAVIKKLSTTLQPVLATGSLNLNPVYDNNYNNT